MPKAIIFDIDGTLVDSVDLHARAWREALGHFGHDLPFDRVRREIGKGSDQLLPALLPREEIAARGEEIERYRADLFKREYLPEVVAFPGVRALFERIQAGGTRIALGSSADRDDLESLKRIAGIDDLVEAETSSDDAEKSKPHPDIFVAALETLGGLSPADVIAIGDTPYDAIAAGKAGIRAIGVLCGGFPEDELREAGCIAVYRDPADLLACYDESALNGR